MDRLDRDFVSELKNVIARLNTPQTTIPHDMEVPKGCLYAVYKRSNKEYNKKVLFNIPLKEAVSWCRVMNSREIKKRHALGTLPDEVYFFDVVKEGTEEESMFWNNNDVVNYEVSDENYRLTKEEIYNLKCDEKYEEGR